jgi:hypothetical protein
LILPPTHLERFEHSGRCRINEHEGARHTNPSYTSLTHLERFEQRLHLELVRLGPVVALTLLGDARLARGGGKRKRGSSAGERRWGGGRGQEVVW